jgi:two-component system, OmpR family, sensor kinase
VLAILVTSVLLASVARSIQDKDRFAFEGEASRTAEAVRERLNTIVTLLHGSAGLFAANRSVDREAFASYMSKLRLRERFPGILGIGYTARWAPSDLDRKLAESRAELGPAFRLWPEHPRDDYHSILYLEPLDERNQAAIGYDMYTEPTRRAAMARARDEGAPAASGKVILVQEIEAQKQAGFLVYLPVFRGPGVPPDVDSRRAALQGFVYAPLRVGDLLQGVRGTGIRQVNYELYDGATPQAGALMRSTRTDDATEPAFTTSRQLEIAGRTWLLQFSSHPEFESLSQRRLLPWLAGASLAFSLLLAWITFLQARARRDAELAGAQRRMNEVALRQSEERERDRAQRLEELTDQLREGDRRKDEFLAVLAHELRNPLAPIRTSLEIIRRSPHSQKAEQAREMAARQVAHMVRLIDDLLDVSRISRGKIVLQRRQVKVADVVQAAVETAQPLIDAAGHELRLAPIEPELEFHVDATRVAQILTNLLNNAANYTPKGGRIEVAVQADDEFVDIRVRDNGIGIEPAKLRQLFELFVQADNPSSGNGGLGIGLSLAARLAELHGGRVEGRSAGLGRGAEFELILPRGQQQAVPAAAGGESGS